MKSDRTRNRELSAIACVSSVLASLKFLIESEKI